MEREEKQVSGKRAELIEEASRSLNESE